MEALLLRGRLSIDVSHVHLPANRTAALKHVRAAFAIDKSIYTASMLLKRCQGIRT